MQQAQLRAPSPRRRRRRRRWPWLFAVFVLAVLLAVPLVLAPALIPSGLIYAPNSKGSPPADLPPAALRRLGVSTALRVPVGPPPAELSVWILEPASSAASRPATVLVLHGIRDSKISMLGWGRRLAGEGFRAVLVDLRGQGSSSGRFLTYGVVERRDLSQLLDRLLASGVATPPIGAFGASYGAATAIQLAGIDPRLEAVVAVAPFADLRSVVPCYLRRYLPGLWRLVAPSRIQRGVDEAGRLASFDPDQASPRLLVRRAHAQLLILHGSEDRKIPPWQSELILAAAPARVQRQLLPGRDHDSVMGDTEVARQGLAWLKRWLSVAAPRPAKTTN